MINFSLNTCWRLIPTMKEGHLSVPLFVFNHINTACSFREG